MEVRRRRSAASRRARRVAAVGVAVALGSLASMALAAGTALADEPGRCQETVDVRAEPTPDAPVIGRCPAGTEVQVGEMRPGYLYLTDYRGWVAWEFVTLGAPAGSAPPPARDRPSAATTSTATTSTAPTAPATAPDDPAPAHQPGSPETS